MWNSGRKNCTWSSSRTVHAEFQLITDATNDRWVWRTAFGSPVVPELNGYAKSASSTASGSAAGRVPGAP